MSKRKVSSGTTELKVVSASSVERSLSICHISDIHLGYRRYGKLTAGGLNQRELDVNQAFSEAITRIISLRPSLTLIVGDLFHSVRPSNAIITFCFREIRRLALGTSAPVVIVAGNHETPKRNDTGNVLRLLAEIPGVYVADQVATRFRFEELDTSIMCLPHSALLALRADEVRAEDRFTFNLLALHAQIDRNWISDFGGAEIALGALSPHEWDYIALGHVHVYREVLHNAAYSGSVEHTAASIWSEANRNKGFLQIALPSGKRTFHALSSPREVLSLEPIDCAGQEPSSISTLIDSQLESVAGGAEGKIIKLVLRNITREVYRQLDHKMIRRWRQKCLNLTLDLHSPQIEGALLRPALSRRGHLTDELRSFCKQFPIQASTPSDIENVLIHYLKKVEENYEAREASPEAVSAAS